jgi:hypothetical protein
MNRARTILFSLLLTLPVILFVAHHYTAHSPELKPTGFTIDENVLYMSYAHQYLDDSHFSVLYSNPFDGDPASPKIYFQPVNIVFAAAMKAGADPGLTFSLFGIIMAFLCILMGVKIIQHLLEGQKNYRLMSLLFIWGGGLTALTGLLIAVVVKSSANPVWPEGIFLGDPARGWWGLNWGRTLFIPLEAYYHFLFLLNIYLLLKKRWAAAIVAAAFLSVSHPFTGIEYLLIVNGWIVLEKIIFKNKNIPYWFLAGMICVSLFHCWYYLYFLNQFAEHRQLFSQYSAGWTYSYRVFIPAYCLVTLLAIITKYLQRREIILSISSYQRFFLTWAIIAFLLSKHEWLIKPMQPIHFTRGYVWAGLFLFALPGISWLIDKAKTSRVRQLLLVFCLLIFLSDNTLWSGVILAEKNKTEWEGYITKDTEAALAYLKTTSRKETLVVGNAYLVNYLLNVYTPANSWVSHPYNTPRKDERTTQVNEFLKTGILPAEWKLRKVVIVLNKKDTGLLVNSSLLANKVFENNTYLIFTP